MAISDYRTCDVCGRKAFYDATLNYDWDGSGQQPRAAGEASTFPPLDYLGDWAVLCKDCAQTHKTAIVPNTSNKELANKPKGGEGNE